jgi:hypothetical protein
MAQRGRRNVNNVRLSITQERVDIIEALLDCESFRQLLGHQLLAITGSDKARAADSSDLGRMLIGDLSAADYRDAKGFHDAGFLW